MIDDRLLFVVVALIIGVLLGYTLGDNECHAPCTVSFYEHVEEDDVAFDYAHHQVRVWTKPVGHP